MNTPVATNAPASPPRVPNPFASSPVVAAPQGGLSNALAARESQQVLAWIWAARSFPRNVRDAVDRITVAFSRPSLCEVAMYAYSRGGENISGLSIRAAEELARQWHNVRSGTEEFRGDGFSECVAFAYDLETGTGFDRKFHVKHWRETKSGGYPVRNERDIAELVANQGARRERAMILKVIPGDVQDIAERQIELTLKTTAEVNAEVLQKLLEKFKPYGVLQEHIEQRIQRHLDAMLPAQLVHLRRIFQSLRDGMSTAGDWFELRPPIESRADAGASAEELPQPASATETAKAKLKARKVDKPEPIADADAVNLLRKCVNAGDLAETYAEVRSNYADTGRPLPVDVEAVRKDMMAKFEQQAE